MPQDARKKALIFAVLALFAVLAVAGYGVLRGEHPAPAVAEEAADAAPLSQEELEKALNDRILGDPDAPVKISEHSSLTCPHCAHFHKDSLPRLKAEFIDTGKAYMVFSDFPLNAPALQASMIARCLPEDKYFPFVEMLFAEQDKWAFEAGYLTFLKTKAAESGLDEEKFNSCLQSKELQEGLAARMQTAQKQWEIHSTPSLVINNKDTISGNAPLEEIGALINGKSAEQP